jgi:hypothetical protein
MRCHCKSKIVYLKGDIFMLTFVTQIVTALTGILASLEVALGGANFVSNIFGNADLSAIITSLMNGVWPF